MPLHAYRFGCCILWRAVWKILNAWSAEIAIMRTSSLTVMMPQERLIPFARYYVSSCAFDSTGKRNWSCRSMHQERKIPKKRFVNRSACYAFICRLLKSTSTEIAEPDFTLLIDAIVSQVHPSAVPAVVSRTMRSADSVRL